MFHFCLINLFVVSIHWIWVNAQQTQGFNAAIGSTISANVTCGFPAEQYFNTRQGYVAPRDRALSLCNASDPRYAHPATNMIDGQFNSFWQSANNFSDAFITINFKQAFLGKTIKFTFGDYRRPGQIAIFKSTDFGKTYTAWHYQVTSRSECTSVFKLPANLIFPYPDKINRTVCAEYQTYPLEYDEVITILLNGNQRGDGSANFDSPELRAWLNVTNIHIRFTGLFRKFDFIDTRWHHYVVREIDVTSVCDCNGHGNGLVCPVNSQTGLRECQCADNTCGANCDRCCPGYNQYLWKKSTGPSWQSDPNTACEKCNCFNHSNECVYNATVASLRLSLDIKSNYSGGGVCLSCQDNTEGINCQRCKKFFYRPEGRARNLTDSCIACGCFANGTANQSGFDFLECIRDETAATQFPGKKSGDCFCKSFVGGRACKECKNGYYRLEGTNPQGCLSCNCHLPGTVNRNSTCNKDYFGQCNCKQNVQLRNCGQCKDGFYGLSDAEPAGCKACDCDVGASSSPICNKGTGQCQCRSNLLGRTCLRIVDGYYYPNMHFIYGSRNLYTTASASLLTTINVPRTTFYRIYVAYSMPRVTSITLTLRLQKGILILSSGNLPNTTVNFCNTECFAVFTVMSTIDFSLASGIWNVTVVSSVAEPLLKIERLILIPQFFYTASILSSANRNWFFDNCNVTSNDMRIGTANEQRCLSYVYSLTTYFNNGALPCNCHLIGSTNSTCQKYGGQCHCKPGVGERDCSKCLPGFYNFSSTGCTPCGCKGPNKICDPVTGVCQCPSNTVGRVCDPCACNNNSIECLRNGDCINCGNNSTSTRCEVCKQGYFGNAKTQNCQPCNCHIHGSLNQTCDSANGQCYCKAGVVGLKCDRCLPNYYGLITTGCFPCNCNRLGSSSLQCAANGQCPCARQATSLRCDSCKPNFFGLPTKTCQPCNCDLTGTVSGTFCNRDLTGQCQCKPGITGRTCNQCMRQYVNFTSAGCERCSLCTRQMQATVDQMKTQLATLQIRVNETKNMSLLQTEIVRLQTRTNSLQVAAVLHSQRVQKGQSDYQYLTSTYMEPLTQRHDTLVSTVSRVSQTASGLVPIAASNATRMKSLEALATSATSLSQTAATTASSVFSSLVTVTKSSDTLVSRTFADIQQISLNLHQSMLTTIDADLALSNAARANVSNIGQTVQSQQSFSNSLTSSVQEASTTLAQWNTTWRRQLPQFLLDIQNVYRRGNDLLAIVNSTRILILQQDQYIRETQTRQATVQTILKEANQIYKQSQAVFEQSKIHTIAVSGTLQVSILQHVASILTVKILNGRNLAARDFPSQLSDPYCTVSLRPDWNTVGPKQTRIINGTLNPDWPIADSYMFSLSREQLQQTSVVINVYDKDPDNPDDFMGEVVINLTTVPGIQTGTVTRNYQIRPKGYESIWTGSFSGSQNSLVDLQQILSSQLTTTDALMTQAETAASQAQSAATNLQSQANMLSTSFASAKSHASAAVNAVNTYREIYRLINSSLVTVNAANKSVNEILTLMQRLSLSALETRAEAAIIESQLLLSLSTARNLSQPTIQMYLRSETVGSPGISSPPTSIIEIDGVDYSKKLGGFNIAVIDSKMGVVESSVNFRLDVDQGSAKPMIDFLDRIPGQKIVVMVKQSQAAVPSFYQALFIGQLMSFGAVPPIIGAPQGSYALLGYKRTAGESVTWVKQVGKNPGTGVSEIRQNVPLRSSLAELVSLSNATFQSAWPKWQEINSKFTTLRILTERFLLTESIATIVQSSLQAANIILRQATDSASRVLIESIQFNRTIYEITTKFNQIVFMVRNATNLISNASLSVSQAEQRLPFQFNNVNTAKTLYSQMNVTSQQIDNRLKSMEGKLTTLKRFTTQIPFAIQFDVSASAVYQLQGYSTRITKVLYNDIGFDMKTNRSEGIILYLLSQPGKMQYSIGIYLQNGFIYLIYHLGFGQTVVRNDMKIAPNQWYYVHVARQGKRAVFTVRDANGSTISAHGTSIYTQDSTRMDFSSASRVYLAGFAAGYMTSLVTLYGQYSGIIDNLVINSIKYNIWNHVSFSGNLYYAMTRHGFRPAVSSTWISLFGNGYIRQNVGAFQINSAYSEMQLEFRTLKDNVVLLGVTDSTGSFVYALYIIGGKLLFQFSSGVGQNAALMTQRNTYVDGKWYKVKMIRTSINATLSVSLVGSTNAVHTETINVFAQTSLPQGISIIFGAPPSTNAAALPTSGVFAGDIRNLYVSILSTKQMQLRSFNSIDKVSEAGMSYYDMVAGQVVKGARFYGFMWWKNFGAYSSLVPGTINLITSLTFVFKTTQMTGMIMYSNENNHYLRNQGALVYFYMALFGGDLVITLHDSNFASLSPYMSQNLTLSDGKWHNVSLTYQTSSIGYQLHVDGILVFTGWFGNFKREIAASNPMYFGGTPSTLSIPFAIPTKVSLAMDVQNLFINSRVQNFHQSTSYGVSYAGVAPSSFEPQPTGPPPTCGAGFPSLVSSTDANEIQFGQLPWLSNQSYIGYNLNEEQKSFLKSSFVVTIVFKATSKDGIVYYTADNATNPRQYISLELINGRLWFRYNLGESGLAISTTNDYADGKWYLIHMLRINTFGAILLPTSKEYQSSFLTAQPSDILINTPMYIGGLPNSVQAPSFTNRKMAFNGCIKRFEIASSFRFYSLNLAAPHIRKFSSGSSSCYANVEPGTFFNGSGWVFYDNNFSIGANFTFSISFKTNKRSGLLFYTFTNATQRGADNQTLTAKFIVAEINEGKINVHYKPMLNEAFQTVSWIDPKSNSSYMVCDQQWHSLTIKLQSNRFSITVDSYTTTLQVSRSDNLVGNLYIGGVPDNVLKPGGPARHFDGCLRSIVFNTRRSIYDARFGENVRLGCPIPQ